MRRVAFLPFADAAKSLGSEGMRLARMSVDRLLAGSSRTNLDAFARHSMRA